MTAGTDAICVPSEAIELRLSGGFTTWIDAADFERPLSIQFRDGFVWEARPCDRRWKPHVKRHTTYVICLVQRGGRIREVRLHRLLLCARPGQLVDHRNGNGLHNWRGNLRIATAAGNAANRCGQPNSSSRFKGVAFHKNTGRWEARIRYERRLHHLGLFSSEEAAGRAYDAAAVQLFGVFARLNFDDGCPPDRPTLRWVDGVFV